MPGKMDSNQDSGHSRRNGPDGEALGEIVDAVREMSRHVRTIKLALVAYVVLIAASMAWTSAVLSIGALIESYKLEIEDSLSSGSGAEDQASNQPSVGDALPAIALPDASGRVWTNEDWEGKALIVNFWATWCPPCIEEMPLFEKALEEYGAEGLAIVAISLDRKGWDVLRPFIERHQPTYTVLLAGDELAQGLDRVRTLPTTFFVGRDGVIASKRVGGLRESILKREVKRLLTDEMQPAPSSSTS